MKNQYFGDVNDYRKYGILRLLRSKTINLGVCWMRTPTVINNHGNETSYLMNQRNERRFDPNLFDALKICKEKAQRRISSANSIDILDDTICFGKELTDNVADRKVYFAEAMKKLR